MGGLRVIHRPKGGDSVVFSGSQESEPAVTALAIVRDVRRRYSCDTAGCADATLALDEVARRIRAEKRKHKRKAAK